jgi:hypothetical protein
LYPLPPKNRLESPKRVRTLWVIVTFGEVASKLYWHLLAPRDPYVHIGVDSTGQPVYTRTRSPLRGLHRRSVLSANLEKSTPMHTASSPGFPRLPL